MLTDAIRKALLSDNRTWYEIAKEAGIEPDVLYRFRDGKDIRLTTAEKICKALGLELKHAKARTTK